jgi:thiamine pyrophosphate-dependent acetolactate synthase large subunit-like protein
MPSRSAAEDRSSPLAGPAAGTGMLRTEAAEILAAARGELLSVVTMQAIRPWKALGQSDSRNFYVQGAMGSAAAIGLGLALARPDERVLVIDGDGSLLMQLGSLVSIADLQPANLVHVVFENGIYETSGGQSVPGRQVADLTSIALASGYRHARRFSAAAHLRAEAWPVLRLAGPVLVALDISGPGRAELPPDFVPVPDTGAQIQNMRDALSAGAG